MAVDAAEQAARGRRLIVIIVVVAVILVGAVAWGFVSKRAVSDTSASAQTELRALWTPLDLVRLESQYTSGPTGNFDVLPQPSDAQFASGGFVRAGVFAASYDVQALGRSRCLSMRVTGDTPPNRIRFREHDGHC